jgi:flagellar hook protein FlgE
MQSQVNIYDSSGASHIIQYTWIPANTAVGANANAVATPPASWTLNATLMGLNGAANTNLGSINLTFAADGTPSAINTATGTAAILPVGPPAGPLVAGDPVTVQFSAALPTVAGGAAGPQNISVNLGNLLQTTGVTQFAATAYTLRSLNQDGVPPGSFSSISTKASGDIYANYDNGQTRLIARVPIATFGNADGLQRQNGSAFTVTLDSGNPSLQDAGTNGSGSIVVKSVEGSNVDIGNEFTKLIVAQRAYSANAKIVTSADEMMQTTLDMKR